MSTSMARRNQYHDRVELLQGKRQRWVRSEWKHTESKQRAKYYQITAVGKKQLASDLSRWQRIVEAIGAVIGREPREGEA